MSRYAALDLSQYPIADILSGLDYEAGLSALLSDFSERWEALRVKSPSLPAIDTLLLESEPIKILLEVIAYRELLLRAHVNDSTRNLSLSGARGAALDHIGATYFRRTTRLQGPDGFVEDDETYRARLAVAPESWSSAGPEGAYVFFGYSASPDVLDLAIYSVDEGMALPAVIKACVLARGTASWAVEASLPLLSAVRSGLLKRDRIPTADHIEMVSAQTVDYSIAVELHVAPGILHEPIRDAAIKRLTAWSSGQRRWAGDNVEGPVWLIGRTVDPSDVKAIAWGGDSNIVGARVISPTAAINPVHPDYATALAAYLANQTDPDILPLASHLTAHMLNAPVMTSVTVTTVTFQGDV